jgi:hypothetical protein
MKRTFAALLALALSSTAALAEDIAVLSPYLSSVTNNEMI